MYEILTYDSWQVHFYAIVKLQGKELIAFAELNFWSATLVRNDTNR
jgi:hypothetical protein